MPRRPAFDRLAGAGVLLGCLLASACGKDSYFTDPAPPTTQVEYGEGVEVVTPTATLVRLFADFAPESREGHPAIPLQALVGADAVSDPVLYGYRLIGTDGYYADMPGKRYGDNTWAQLAIGYLDLATLRVVFATEQDPMLRKGHNVKWLIRVDVLRSIDVVWDDGRRLVPVAEVAAETVPEGFPEAGASGSLLTAIILDGAPRELVPEDHLYRVIARDGSELPRLLTWEEASSAWYLHASDRVVLREALGPAYRLSLPRAVRIEGGVDRPADSAPAHQPSRAS